MARGPNRTTSSRRRRTLQLQQPEAADAMESADETFARMTAELNDLRATAELQRNHIEACRRAFFTLAQHRAAAMVVHERKGWEEATAYINAEMQGLDQVLASLTPPVQT